MAKLYLKFEQATLKEVTLSQQPVTIGRLPDNALAIDNLAVSGHHARLYWEIDHYVIEDLGSLNGTYVNNQRVGKARLKDGDQMLIGKHLVLFKDESRKIPPADGPAAKPGPATPKLDATVMLDTKRAQEMLAAKAPAAVAAARTAEPAKTPSAAKERVGVLTVVGGKTDQAQYVLTSKMTMIGKSEMASIRLKGLFAPHTAALISKRDNKYFIAASEKKVKININGEDVMGQRELKEGDLIQIAGIKATFAFQN